MQSAMAIEAMRWGRLINPTVNRFAIYELLWRRLCIRDGFN